MTEEMERLGTTAWERAIAGVHWRPDKHTGVAVVSYLLVVAVLFVAFQVFTTERVAANFITFGIVGLAGAGVAVPVFYTVFIRRRPLADLGLTTRFLVPSLILGLLLGWDTYRNTVATIDVAWTPAIVPLATMTLAVGLFEAVFFRGWRDSFLPVIAGVRSRRYRGGLSLGRDRIEFGTMDVPNLHVAGTLDLDRPTGLTHIIVRDQFEGSAGDLDGARHSV